MKKIKVIINQPSINKLIGSELSLSLSDDASIVDAIMQVDKMIVSKGCFPVADYGNLLHMIYHPVENRFYKQVAITAYKEQNQTLNVRDNPKKELPEEVTIILIPAGGCISEWEEAVDYKEFLKQK
jgi:hypothetical protein